MAGPSSATATERGRKKEAVIGTPQLWEVASKIAAALKEPGGPVRIIGHYDCDGLTASAILATACQRAAIPFHLTNLTGLRVEDIEALAAEGPARILLVDMGSGQRELLSKLKAAQLLVIDHHIQQGKAPKGLLELNAHAVGLDGSYEACSATLALAVAVSLDKANWDLVQPALAGLIGDRQHLPQPRGYSAALIAEGVKRGHLTPSPGLGLPADKPLTSTLADSLDPYFVGWAGRPEAVEAWLTEKDLDPSATPAGLERKQLRYLANLLLARLLEQGATPEAARKLFFPIYRLADYPLDAERLAKAVDSAGRKKQMALGVAAAMGDKLAVNEITTLQAAFEKPLREGLIALEVKGASQSTKGAFGYFFKEDPSVKGSLAGLGASYWLARDRPLISFSRKEKSLNISGRGTRTLVENGLDLAQAMAQAAGSCEGQGGGHPIAAGASVPLAREADFLAALDEQLAAQAYFKS